VTVAVLDEGVGLTDEQLPRVFEPFYTTKPDGMGLGLPICQMIVTAHDGNVSVERRPEGGSVFFFTLPTLASREAASDTPPLASVSGNL
jgi:signal transduction histidine kinase